MTEAVGSAPPRPLEPLQIEGAQRPWDLSPFTLDEDEEPLLAARPAGPSGWADPPAAAAAAAAGREGLKRRTASRFQLLTESDETFGWASYKHEAGRILALAVPVAVSQFSMFMLGLIAVAFVGRLGEEEMAIAVLATSFSNVTGFSVVLGLLGALDTLCGQAWGAKQYRQLGVHLQRALITTLASCTAVALLWLHVEPLLLLVGQHEAIAAGAARFLRLCIPALAAAGAFECGKRYLMAQGVVHPVTAVSGLALLACPVFNWLFIFKLKLGLDGAVAALVATWLYMLCLLGIFMVWHERRRYGTPEQTWHGWTRESFKGLGSYYKLAVPSTLMVCLEWWAYEFTIFIAGWLPNATLNVASMGAMMQVSGFAYMLPLGLSCAASVRVSNALGANLPNAARRSARAAAGLTACTQAALAAALVLGRNVWGRAFTDLEEVVAVCAAAFPIMSACMFGDGFNATIGGVLRGAGRQELGALLNLLSYWGLGLPAAYLLAVKAGWGLKGLWCGLVLCTSVQGVVMLVVLSRFNWKKEAERAAVVLEAAGSDAINSGSGGIASSEANGGLGAAAEAGAAGLSSEDSAALLSGSKQGGRPGRKSPGGIAALRVAGGGSQDEV